MLPWLPFDSVRSVETLIHAILPNMTQPPPVVLVNAVGLTPGLLKLAPVDGALRKLAAAGSARAIAGTFPPHTRPAQASILTGAAPSQHGVVANGWYRRELGEVRFWVQAAAQMQVEPVTVAAKRIAKERGQDFTIASVFWWFAQGASADYMITPKPHYGADGSKAFDILTNPPKLAADLKGALGEFPFHTFWGPMAGVASSDWIANAACRVINSHRPNLTLVYLPHLDYQLQRIGPTKLGETGLKHEVAQLDRCIAAIQQAAERAGMAVVVISEYGLTSVNRAVLPNLELRRAGLLTTRHGPFGEMLDPTASRAFAVCDHQIAHVYLNDPDARSAVTSTLAKLPGVARVLDGDELEQTGLAHPRSGELVLLAESGSWFAYPYWEDDQKAPDFARTVDIHRKPGYDPCELFLDPGLSSPKLRLAAKLAAKKLGFRALLDVIPLRPDLVGGSHGRLEIGEHGPCIITPASGPLAEVTAHVDIKSALLRHWDYDG